MSSQVSQVSLEVSLLRLRRHLCQQQVDHGEEEVPESKRETFSDLCTCVHKHLIFNDYRFCGVRVEAFRKTSYILQSTEVLLIVTKKSWSIF